MKFRNKIIILAIGLTLLLGVLMVFFIQYTFKDALVSELKEKGVFLAKYLAKESADDVLTDNRMALQLRINNIIKDYRDIEYIFIMDGAGKIFAHTFENGFPVELMHDNNYTVNEEEGYRIRHLKTNKGNIYEINANILKNQVGMIHMGYNLIHINKLVSEVTQLMLTIIVAVVLLGGVIAIFIAIRLSRPLTDLTAAAKIIGSGNMKYRVKNISNDEMGALSKSFNKMADELENTISSRDREIAERKKTGRALLKQSEKLDKTNLEITDNKKKLQTALNTASLLIQQVIRNNNYEIIYSNDHLQKCYETKKCNKKDCPCYGKEAMRCWQVAGTFCGGAVQGEFAQKYSNCSECNVFQAATPDSISEIQEQFHNMMHVINNKDAELSEKEVRLNSVVEYANDAIISVNSNGKIDSWNQGAEKMFGYPAETIIGKSVTSIMPENYRKSHENGIKQFLSTRKSKILGQTVEIIGLRKDGSEFPLELCVSTWTSGDETYFTSIIRDITERKNAEMALEQSQSTIIQQEKMASVGQLAGGIAHDFNNILSVITGYSELTLKDLKEDSPLKENISTIHAAGEKAAALTKELLAFSRKQPLQMKVSSLNATIDNMKNILIRLIGENIRLKISTHKDLKNVLGDKTQMEQVLMNLIVNARDAMPDGGELLIKTLNVQFKREFTIGNERFKPGSYAVLSVRDTGSGMSKEVQESIFEPFFSTKDVGKGTGMGLSTVYGVVKQHGGYITVHSNPGDGTVFKVYIPATDKEAEEEIAIQTIDVTGDETILIVDDEPLIIGLLTEMLDPLGYRVLGASNGEEALKVCTNFPGRIDLLLTDVMMPGMNGRELAEKFTVKSPETKVIYMSGYTDDAIAHHGVLEDGVVLINKPIKSSVVASKIREVLGAKIHQADNQSADEKLSGIHILLVDDNADIRNLVQVYLKDYDCTIDTAENGEIAVNKFRNDRYNFVLMDMQMPVMDGPTAVTHMREWEKESGSDHVMIIALTGNAAQEEIDRCLGAGYSSHLAKPIKKDALVNAMVSNIPATQSDVCAHDIVQEEKEERFIAHVDADLKDLIPEYLEERQSDINRIQEAVRLQDYETVRILGHTLKGSGGGYGFGPITEMGMHIEGAAKEEDFEVIEHWNNKLSDYINNIEIIYEE